MSTLQWVGLLLLAAFAGAVVPFQSAINSNLARGLAIRYGQRWPHCW